MSFSTMCDKSLESLIRNEFEVEYLQCTLDMILEMIEKLATIYKEDGDLYVPSYHNYNEIMDILKYRHPEEFRNMVERVHERDNKKVAEEDYDDE